jgi:hypothetical protein
MSYELVIPIEEERSIGDRNFEYIYGFDPSLDPNVDLSDLTLNEMLDFDNRKRILAQRMLNFHQATYPALRTLFLNVAVKIKDEEHIVHIRACVVKLLKVACIFECNQYVVEMLLPDLVRDFVLHAETVVRDRFVLFLKYIMGELEYEFYNMNEAFYIQACILLQKYGYYTMDCFWESSFFPDHTLLEQIIAVAMIDSKAEDLVTRIEFRRRLCKSDMFEPYIMFLVCELIAMNDTEKLDYLFTFEIVNRKCMESPAWCYFLLQHAFYFCKPEMIDYLLELEMFGSIDENDNYQFRPDLKAWINDPTDYIADIENFAQYGYCFANKLRPNFRNRRIFDTFFTSNYIIQNATMNEYLNPRSDVARTLARMLVYFPDSYFKVGPILFESYCGERNLLRFFPQFMWHFMARHEIQPNYYIAKMFYELWRHGQFYISDDLRSKCREGNYIYYDCIWNLSTRLDIEDSVLYDCTSLIWAHSFAWLLSSGHLINIDTRHVLRPEESSTWNPKNSAFGFLKELSSYTHNYALIVKDLSNELTIANDVFHNVLLFYI